MLSSTTPSYTPFIIRLRNFDRKTFNVEVVSSPTGRMRSAENIQFNYDVLPYVRKLAHTYVQGPMSDTELSTMGEILANMLMPPTVRNLFLDTWTNNYNPAEKKGIRLLLEVDDDTLAILPWEYIYLKEYKFMRCTRESGHGSAYTSGGSIDTNYGFLGLDPWISIARNEPYIGVKPVLDASKKSNELNVLITNAEPTDMADINVAGEVARIEADVLEHRLLQAFLHQTDLDPLALLDAQPVINTDVVRNLTREKLQDSLANGGKKQIFHFSGHGGYIYRSSVTPDGQVILLKELDHQVPDTLSPEDEVWERRFERLAELLDPEFNIENALALNHESAQRGDTRLIVFAGVGFGDEEPTEEKDTSSFHVFGVNDHKEGALAFVKPTTTHTWQDYSLADLRYGVKLERGARKRANENGVKDPDNLPLFNFLNFQLDNTIPVKKGGTVVQEPIASGKAKDIIDYLLSLYPVDDNNEPLNSPDPVPFTDDEFTDNWTKRILPDSFWNLPSLDPAQKMTFLRWRKGSHDVVWADDLAKILSDHDIKLVVLNGCETSQSASTGFQAAGVATTLIQSGIPAVVGMQLAIDDDSAIRFSTTFYQALGNGKTLEEALYASRLAISTSKETSKQQNWGFPTLYISSPTVPDDIALGVSTTAPLEH